MEILITGLSEVSATIAALVEQDVQAGKMALREEAEVIMTTSKQTVPVDTGALRESGHVDMTDDGARLAYGDSAVDYAIVVHEDLDAHHTSGTAKYLERPVLEALPHLPENVATRMKSIRGGA